MAIIKSNRKVLTVKIESVLEKALIVTGEQAVGFVRPLVPVDTGNLRSSITFATVGFRSDPEKVTAKSISDTGGAKISRKTSARNVSGIASPEDLVDRPQQSGHLFVGTNVEYAPHVEFGTNRKGNNETRKGNRLVRRSFLRLGVITHRHELAKTFGDVIRGLLR